MPTSKEIDAYSKRIGASNKKSKHLRKKSRPVVKKSRPVSKVMLAGLLKMGMPLRPWEISSTGHVHDFKIASLCIR